MRTTLLLLAVFITTTAWSQKSGIKVDIFAPIIKTLNIGYERVVSENGTFQIGFSYTADNDGGKLRRVGFTPEYRFYLSETPAPHGFFVAPFVQYFDIRESGSNPYQDQNYSEFGVGVVAGHQWLFKERVTFAVLAGPKYQTHTEPANAAVTVDLTKGFFFRAGVTLGIVF